jgi:hypothetical protein
MAVQRPYNDTQPRPPRPDPVPPRGARKSGRRHDCLCLLIVSRFAHESGSNKKNCSLNLQGTQGTPPGWLKKDVLNLPGFSPDSASNKKTCSLKRTG